MKSGRLIRRLSSSRPRPLAAVPALLSLVIVPRLSAHKRGAPTPEGVGRATRCYSFSSLLRPLAKVPMAG
jgi:hypothetical protein